MIETLQSLPTFIKYIFTAIIGMTPIIEIRGAIPIGVAKSIIILNIFHLPKKSNNGLINFIIKYIGIIFPMKLDIKASR